jgi:hypothetical protein
MFILLGAYAQAQNLKVLAEIDASSERTVKNAPFYAEAVSESVQTLADGNRIVRNSTSKLYRNSEGRFRRDITSGSGGTLSSLYTYGQGVTLLDPVGGFRYQIDPNQRTTRQMVFKPHNEIRIVNGVGAVTADGTIVSDKIRSEIKAAVDAANTAGASVVIADRLKEEIKASVAAAPVIAARAAVALAPMDGVAMAYSMGSNANWEKRTEDLGTQNIEGVDAEGTRTITTIPVGAIGNERPIEITYEKWYSKDLQLVVMSKHNDPRFGEQTYRLTNIVRNEPDPSLFALPSGYRLITEPSGTYTISPKATTYEKTVTKTSQAGTTYVRTKP